LGDNLFDGAVVSAIHPGDHNDVIDQSGKQARARRAIKVDGGNDHRVKALRPLSNHGDAAGRVQQVRKVNQSIRRQG
jgi:hypothetical protein